MEVTNEYVSPKTYVTVEKIWVGGPEPRPTIYIQLYRKIADGDKMMVGDPVGLPSGTNEYTWNNLDVTDYNGNPYIYSVEEAAVAGYVKVIEGFEISNTRIKGTIEFHKHDDSNMPLAGAVFGLYAVTDTMFAAPLKTATSLADGLVRFTDVEYGEYKIKEISAPAGYEKSELVIPVAVTMQGETVVTTPATVVNVKIMGDITLRKVDSVTEEVLAGAKMVIKDKAGTVVFEGTTGADGLLKVELPYGEYIISEVTAPEGYVLTTQTYSINVNKSGLTFDVRIPNTEEEELPQTGGIPSELLYLMGAMAIIGGAVLMKGKRRRIG
jgi:LPXTG-motif cell wall-anchored protein